MIVELQSLPEKQVAVEAHVARCPIMRNYADVLADMSPAEWSAYRIFVDRTHDVVGGLAPEGNFNIYPAEPGALASLRPMLAELLRVRGAAPHFIFGPPLLGEAVAELPLLAAAKAKQQPFLVMAETAASRAALGVSDAWRFMTATPAPEHVELVRQWYDAYNAERHMRWSVPTAAELADPKKRLLLLLAADGRLAAACANTLPSDERLWIGRMYVTPPFRRAKVGSELMRHMLRLARDEAKTMMLHVDSDNTAATSFYERFAFRTVGENSYFRFP